MHTENQSLYQGLYNESYYRMYCGHIAYERSEHWLSFFGRIADRLIEDFAPTTVLDVGCAMGFLVEALRDRGIAAYGVDVSEYAISRVREDIRPFCSVAALPDQLPAGLPNRFDVVTCIEVFEHLPAEDIDEALRLVAGLSDE